MTHPATQETQKGLQSNGPMTIVALATPAGRGGVGIVRVSGPLASQIASSMLGHCPKPRYAHYGPFYALDGSLLDQGIGLFFAGPHSFTGEDVLELQGHGGPVVMDMLIENCLALGARLARPGEFSERAFLNDKLDLAQAEAISDLINAANTAAARSALNSLQGEFSKLVDNLVSKVLQLRIYVEAAIDFPDEEIDFLADGVVADRLSSIRTELANLLAKAQQGALMRDGMTVVIAGRPNAGKSSLLNALAGRETAIVTDIEGTTRDLIKEQIHIDGMPLHLIDTAGLREAPDQVEQIGIERAWQAIAEADQILLLVDSSQSPSLDAEHIWPEFIHRLNQPSNLTLVRNKVDISQEPTGFYQDCPQPTLGISAKQGLGLDELREHLKQLMGYQGMREGAFMARRRHLDALLRAQQFLESGAEALADALAGELLAEDLRAAADSLGEITGRISADDLLGHIFSSFCIGK